jgi:broad specificity phosphatase PhoE
MQKTFTYLIRHAESFHNIGNYEEKSSQKVDLTDEGISQAKKLIPVFADIHLDKIYSSDYVRALRTANFLAESKGMTVTQDQTIRERCFGETYRNRIEQTKKEMAKIFESLNNQEKFEYSHFPDMESAREGACRLNKFLLNVSKNDAGKTIAVVCHGNIMRSFLNLIEWAEFDELPEGAIQNTGFLKIEISNGIFKILETTKVDMNKKTNRIM